MNSCANILEADFSLLFLECRGLSSFTMNTVIDDILTPVADCLTPDVARRLTELRLNPGTQARIDELAEKANEGLLTPDERAEYADIVEGLDFLGILKAQARSVISRSQR